MKENPDPALATLEWVGGHAALDFVNTVSEWRGDEPGTEYLSSYDQLLEWNRMAGLLAPSQARRLGRGHASANGRALRKALELRDALHRLFRALAESRTLPRVSLDRLNETLRETIRWRRLAMAGDGIVTAWDFGDAPPAAILGPVAWQAADLLERGDLDRLKQCPGNDGCGWVFLDTSRNGSRTWCSMKVCGNAAKVRRFRERQG